MVSQKKQTECKCRILRVRSLAGDTVTYECKCRKSLSTRKLTVIEKRAIRAIRVDECSPEGKRNVHKLWNELSRRFLDSHVPAHKRIGYPLMQRLRKFASTHPEILLVSCDDASYATSLLAFVPHQSEYDFHGYTCLYVPQCTGESPITFFLYPSVVSALGTAVKDMKALERYRRKEGHYADSVFSLFPSVRKPKP